MRTEKACGAVVSRQTEEGIIEILLVQQKNGLTAFPKGHLEPGETEIAAASREVLEETGLRIEIPANSPRFEFDYIIPAGALQSSHRSLSAPIHKIVVLFLAQPQKGTETPQASEISSLFWAPLNEVENHLNFPEWRAVWQRILPHLSN